MGFNWTGAAAGLLGEIGGQVSMYQQRQAEFEQKKIEQAIADRKEEAKLARDRFLEEAKIKRDEMRYDAQSERDDKRYDAQAKRDEARETAAERRHRESMSKGGSSDTAFDRKKALADQLLADGKITQAEYNQSILDIKSAEKEKGGLTEYQAMQVEQKLAEAEAEGIDDRNVGSINAMRKRLGMPQLKKVVKEEGKSGILGFGSKEPVYDYVEDWEGTEEPKSEKKEDPKQGGTKQPEKKSEGGLSLDMAKKILSGGKKDPAKNEGMLEQPQESASIDLGTILGAITKSGVEGVKQLINAGMAIEDIDRKLTVEAQKAHAESKPAIIEALKAVKEVMATEGKVDYQSSAKNWRSR